MTIRKSAGFLFAILAFVQAAFAGLGETGAQLPREVTFNDYRPDMGFKLSASKRPDSDVILYAIDLERSIGIRSGVSLMLFKDSKLVGHLDLIVIDVDKDTPGYIGLPRRFAAFSLSSDLSREAMLLIRRDEKDFKEPIFKLPLSSWPVRIGHVKKQ